MSSSTTNNLSATDYFALPESDERFELIHGELLKTPPPAIYRLVFEKPLLLCLTQHRWPISTH
jgi:hypothetical protein